MIVMMTMVMKTKKMIQRKEERKEGRKAGRKKEKGHTEERKE